MGHLIQDTEAWAAVTLFPPYCSDGSRTSGSKAKTPQEQPTPARHPSPLLDPDLHLPTLTFTQTPSGVLAGPQRREPFRMVQSTSEIFNRLNISQPLIGAATVSSLCLG